MRLMGHDFKTLSELIAEGADVNELLSSEKVYHSNGKTLHEVFSEIDTFLLNYEEENSRFSYVKNHNIETDLNFITASGATVERTNIAGEALNGEYALKASFSSISDYVDLDLNSIAKADLNRYAKLVYSVKLLTGVSQDLEVVLISTPEIGGESTILPTNSKILDSDYWKVGFFSFLDSSDVRLRIRPTDSFSGSASLSIDDILILPTNRKELKLPTNGVAGQVLASSTTGVRSLVTVPNGLLKVKTPTIIYPADLASPLATFFVRLNPFYHISAGTHSATVWEIATDSEFTNLVVNDEDPVNLREREFSLSASMDYFIRVKHKDNEGNYSNYSDTIHVTTTADPDWLSYNGSVDGAVHTVDAHAGNTKFHASLNAHAIDYPYFIASYEKNYNAYFEVLEYSGTQIQDKTAALAITAKNMAKSVKISDTKILSITTSTSNNTTYFDNITVNSNKTLSKGSTISNTNIDKSKGISTAFIDASHILVLGEDVSGGLRALIVDVSGAAPVISYDQNISSFTSIGYLRGLENLSGSSYFYGYEDSTGFKGRVVTATTSSVSISSTELTIDARGSFDDSVKTCTQKLGDLIVVSLSSAGAGQVHVVEYDAELTLIQTSFLSPTTMYALTANKTANGKLLLQYYDGDNSSNVLTLPAHINLDGTLVEGTPVAKFTNAISLDIHNSHAEVLRSVSLGSEKLISLYIEGVDATSSNLHAYILDNNEVVAPSYTNPNFYGETGLVNEETITLAPFDSQGGTTHSATIFQVSDDANFNNIVHDSGELGAVTSFNLPSGLSYSTYYYIRTRFKDSAGRYSPWSVSYFEVTNPAPAVGTQYVLTSGTSWTAPGNSPGTPYNVKVELWGAGGGGGGVSAGSAYGGGGGGYTSLLNTSIVVGSSYSYVIGVGGSPSAGNAPSGTSTSMFGISATGGNGYASGNANGGTGVGGDVNYTGGSGAANNGGGGGAASETGNGGAGGDGADGSDGASGGGGGGSPSDRAAGGGGGAGYNGGWGGYSFSEGTGQGGTGTGIDRQGGSAGSNAPTTGSGGNGGNGGGGGGAGNFYGGSSQLGGSGGRGLIIITVVE